MRRWLVVVGPLVLATVAGGADDRFLAGYATAIVERELGVSGRVEVEDGVVSIETEPLDPERRESLERALRGVEGVRDVRVVETETPPSAVAPPRTAAAPGERPGGIVFLPPRELFAPLLADPRWPHFAASYQHYVGSDDQLERVGAASFGETLALVEGRAPLGGRWQASLQAGVFSIFDLDAESADLVNSDFLAALPLSYRRGRVSLLARVLHQSSHLGDEFLLRNRVDRVNLSYEALEGLVSVDVTSWLRAYGGGGGLVHTEPDLDPGLAQGGVELASPWTWPFAGGFVRPVLGSDVQAREETDWDADVSLRGGLQLESRRLGGVRLQLLGEYYVGHSPNGQFFTRDIEYGGFGLHLHL